MGVSIFNDAFETYPCVLFSVEVFIGSFQFKTNRQEHEQGSSDILQKDTVLGDERYKNRLYILNMLQVDRGDENVS